MRFSYRQPTVLAVAAFFAGVVAYGVPSVARADFGPKLGATPQLEIFVDGEIPGNTELAVAVLETGPQIGAELPESLPYFTGVTPPRLNARWLHTFHMRLSKRRPLFHGVRPGNSLQLMVRIGDEPRLYVTNPVEPHPLFGDFRCELSRSAEGTDVSPAKLTLKTTGRQWVDWLIALWDRGILFALIVTLGVEAPIAIAWARFRRQRWTRWLARCVLGNLLTLPALWCVTWGAFVILPGITGGLVTLALCEVAAVIAESLVYALRNATSARQAFPLATLANLASFLAGVAWGTWMG